MEKAIYKQKLTKIKYDAERLANNVTGLLRELEMDSEDFSSDPTRDLLTAEQRAKILKRSRNNAFKK